MKTLSFSSLDTPVKLSVCFLCPVESKKHPAGCLLEIGTNFYSYISYSTKLKYEFVYYKNDAHSNNHFCIINFNNGYILKGDPLPVSELRCFFFEEHLFFYFLLIRPFTFLYVSLRVPIISSQSFLQSCSFLQPKH